MTRATTNNRVQATPGSAFLLFLSHWPSAPAPDRWPRLQAL
jgi:hypothetical protein